MCARVFFLLDKHEHVSRKKKKYVLLYEYIGDSIGGGQFTLLSNRSNVCLPCLYLAQLS